MRSRRSLVSAVLAAALLLGQWLTATHEPDHALQPGADACAVCAYAHGAGSGALPSAPALALEGAAIAPESMPVAAPRATALRHHPIRGPPALLA